MDMMDEIWFPQVESILREFDALRRQSTQHVSLVVFMRGVYGIGKTTFARLLQVGAEAMMLWFRMVSDADMYETPVGYQYDEALAGDAGNRSFHWFVAGLNASYDVIVVDNTNARKNEYQAYLDQATSRNCLVKIVNFACEDIAEAREMSERGMKTMSLEHVAQRYQDFVHGEAEIEQDPDLRPLVVHVFPRRLSVLEEE